MRITRNRILRQVSPMELSQNACSILDEIERQAPMLSESAVNAQLRRLTLQDYGLLMIRMPDSRFPALSARLPSMAPEALQVKITGNHGVQLLIQSLAFVNAVREVYESQPGKHLGTSTVLDFSCGYGRHLRLMRYFFEADRLFGCDALPMLVDACRQARLDIDIKGVDFLPVALPYNTASFDLIYAFSVFTHMSLRAMQVAFANLHSVLKPNGVLVITVRPVEYWRLLDIEHRLVKTASARSAMEEAHFENGFAFVPNPNFSPVDGEAVYGDTTVSTGFLERNFPDWRILGTKTLAEDLYQQLIYLAPKR